MRSSITHHFTAINLLPSDTFTYTWTTSEKDHKFTITVDKPLILIGMLIEQSENGRVTFTPLFDISFEGSWVIDIVTGFRKDLSAIEWLGYHPSDLLREAVSISKRLPTFRKS
jgi:hypothetical protein